MADPIPEMKQRTGITVGGDRITVHCEPEKHDLELQEFIRRAKAGDPELLMQWVIFWQLLTLNQRLEAAQQRAAEATQQLDPTKMVQQVLSQVRNLRKD